MSSMMQVPGRSGGELRFTLAGVPVRVHPWFWIVSALMGLSNDAKAVMIWVAVVFVSVLAHELGHVAAFRTFGAPAEVVLYSFGGLTVPLRGFNRTSFRDVVISAAGPFAGFAFAVLIVAGVVAAGGEVFFRTYLYVIPDVNVLMSRVGYGYTDMALNDLLFVNIYWGLVNLLPVLPLDGGHIARGVLMHRDPTRGLRHAMMLSAACGVGVAGLALYSGRTYLFFLFALLAINSIQNLEKNRRWT